MNNNQISPVVIENGIKLSTADRLYFALARRDMTERLIHVYTLACPSDGHGRYYLNPITEVATFTSSDTANQYVNTVACIIDYQSKTPGYTALCRALRAERKFFRQNTR